MQEEELRETVVNPVIYRSNTLTVASPEQYKEASDFLKELKTAQAQVTEFFADIKQKAHAAWKAITAKESALLDPLTQAEKLVNSKRVAFYDAEEKRREEERQRLQAKADEEARKERERLEKRAEKLKTPELKQQAIEQAESIVAPIVEIESTVKDKGTSVRKTWKAAIDDKAAFLKAAAADQNLAAFVTIDESKLNKIAAATQGQVSYPGIRFYQHTTLAARTK